MKESDLVLAVQRTEDLTLWSGIGTIVCLDKKNDSLFLVLCDDGLVRLISAYDIIPIGEL